MTHLALLERYDRELRRDLESVDGRRQELPHRVRVVLPPPRMSYIAYSDLGGLDDDAVDEIIAAEIDFARSHGGPLEWTVYDHDLPGDLVERLARRGFTPDESETVMALDLAAAPPLPVAATAAATVREIGAAELPAVQALLERVWGRDFSWLGPRLASHLARPGYLRVFVAEIEGEVVSAGWIYLHPGSSFAGLYGGSTLPEYRGRGLYTALLAARAEAARAAGYGYLTIDAGPMSRPIVARHDFERLTEARPCIWRPDGV